MSEIAKVKVHKAPNFSSISSKSGKRPPMNVNLGGEEMIVLHAGVTTTGCDPNHERPIALIIGKQTDEFGSGLGLAAWMTKEEALAIGTSLVELAGADLDKIAKEIGVGKD